ncbi:MAG: PilX N-terminal domain-containing pilus assembly protein [Gammaproteobacteria bacterium]
MTAIHSKQNGAALFVCLMLLLVMTLIGVSAITSSTLEEKMAGNIRNKHLSFQAAEAALRAGEAVAAGLPSDTNFNGTNGLYPRTNVDDPDFPIWNSAANWASYDLNAVINPDVVQNPQYIIENFGTAPRDNSCALEVPPKPGCMLPVYRVTARGWGLNLNTSSMIQSTYKQL